MLHWGVGCCIGVRGVVWGCGGDVLGCGVLYWGVGCCIGVLGVG